MVKIETDTINPICPYCDKEIDKLIMVDRGYFAVARVFCCPLCKKIIGMSGQ